MQSVQITIDNPSGLHARPAAAFAALAGKFTANIRIRNLDSASNFVNAKSVIMLLTLGLSSGALAEIETNGPEETEAMAALTGFIRGGCGE